MTENQKPANPTSEPSVRHTYTKPTITRVELRAEEAVLGACKTASTAGPNVGGQCLGPPTACTTLAS